MLKAGKVSQQDILSQSTKYEQDQSEILNWSLQSGKLEQDRNIHFTWEEKLADISGMQLAGLRGCFVKIK